MDKLERLFSEYEREKVLVPVKRQPVKIEEKPLLPRPDLEWSELKRLFRK